MVCYLKKPFLTALLPNNNSQRAYVRLAPLSLLLRSKFRPGKQSQRLTIKVCVNADYTDQHFVGNQKVVLICLHDIQQSIFCICHYLGGIYLLKKQGPL